LLNIQSIHPERGALLRISEEEMPWMESCREECKHAVLHLLVKEYVP
jgi:hypothetical protein